MAASLSKSEWAKTNLLYYTFRIGFKYFLLYRNKDLPHLSFASGIIYIFFLMTFALLLCVPAGVFADSGSTQVITLEKKAPVGLTWTMNIPTNMTITGPGDSKE